ncbi:GLUG motif-containing protein [Paenibacillus xylanivorans]|uniref:GLUG motif-containing protein n=1 Tax=Paenibacillus xylanivorans TaxID=1705561 RepID=UPI000AE9BFE3|nr:GLUG motif-containing protein [Paenibacillus xylanivorans]
MMGTVIGVDSVGGLAGYNVGGEIDNTYATEAVNGNSDVGGLIGNGLSPKNSF